MKTFGLALVIVGLTFAVLPATAQEACKTSFDLVGMNDNLWHVGSATNPTLTACPEQSITIKATSESGVHNIAVDDVAGAPAASDAIDEGASFDYVFTAPASGSGTYICKFHSGTMKGTINFAATSAAATTPAAGGSAETKDSPGVATIGILVSLIGAALIVGRRR